MKQIKRIISVFSAFLFIWSIIPVYVLELSHAEQNTWLNEYLIKPETSFDLTHIHSVELVPIRETYAINKKCGIFLEEIIFSSYGAGLPHTTEHAFEMIPGGMRIYNMHMPISDFIIRDAQDRGRHTLWIAGCEVVFSEIAEPYTPIRLRVVRKPMLNHWLKEVWAWITRKKI